LLKNGTSEKINCEHNHTKYTGKKLQILSATNINIKWLYFPQCLSCILPYKMCTKNWKSIKKKSSIKPLCTKECIEKTSSPQNFVHSDANEEASNNSTQDNITHDDHLAAIQDMGSLIKNDAIFNKWLLTIKAKLITIFSILTMRYID
jgi:hypothetical protein